MFPEPQSPSTVHVFTQDPLEQPYPLAQSPAPEQLVTHLPPLQAYPLWQGIDVPAVQLPLPLQVPELLT